VAAALILGARRGAGQLSATPGYAGDARDDPMGPLRGEYGFLHRFGGISEEQARDKVRLMQANFGIMEFQFYNAFSGYSHPPAQNETRWYTGFGHNAVDRDILEAYIDEIKFWGGRAWVTVQAMGTDVGDKESQKDFKVWGSYDADGEPLVDVVAPTAEWARHWAPRWVDWAKRIGFSGIHWNTLGNFEGLLGENSDIAGFLRETKRMVDRAGLGQTFNFVDGYGFDESLAPDRDKVVAFVYWPAWSRPAMEDEFNQRAPPGSVFLCFPGKDEHHEDEWWQEEAKGRQPFDLMIERWQRARCHGNAFLGVGDGTSYITTDYYPDAEEMTDEQVRQVIDKVFLSPPCSIEPA